MAGSPASSPHLQEEQHKGHGLQSVLLQVASCNTAHMVRCICMWQRGGCSTNLAATYMPGSAARRQPSGHCVVVSRTPTRIWCPVLLSCLRPGLRAFGKVDVHCKHCSQTCADTRTPCVMHAEQLCPLPFLLLLCTTRCDHPRAAPPKPTATGNTHHTHPSCGTAPPQTAAGRQQPGWGP